MSKTRLLLVDDDDAVRITLGAVLQQHDFQVTLAATVAEALEKLSTEKFEVLLADLNVGQPGDGFTVVSAMRRVQPEACTFILTGYPDFESAIQAIRSQVDDYFAKPLKVEELLASISSVRAGKRRSPPEPELRKVSEALADLESEIVSRWVTEVLVDPEIAELPLTLSERSDHIPQLLAELIRRLDGPLDMLTPIAVEAARKHGKARFLQGYTIPQILFEGRVLQQVISATIRETLLTVDLSTLVSDILGISEALQGALEISVRTYQSQIPRSLQTSFSQLYQSPYLGVLIADENRIIDANDAFMKMIGRQRDELLAGDLDWHQMTPARFHSMDNTALEQLREFGTCVPYEKEYSLPNGTKVPFLIGGVRLGLEPFQWSAYVVDVTEQRKLHAADEKLKAWQMRYKLINLLAHELNNPLAAMTFTLHLLRTREDLSDDTLTLLHDAASMLDRVSATVSRVLVESSEEASWEVPKL